MISKKEKNRDDKTRVGKTVYDMNSLYFLNAERLFKSFGWCAEPGWRNGIRTSLKNWRCEQHHAGSRFFNENPAPGARNQRSR